MQILAELESRTSIEPIEPNEQTFFIDAMDIAAAANNLNIAERIEALYCSKVNKTHLASFVDEHK